MTILFTLTLVFTQLSLLAFAGGNAILPEMQNQVVHIHQWMTTSEFSFIFALAQAAPNPNIMIVPLIGWHVAGPAGLLVTSIAKFAPSSILTVFALKFWHKFKAHPLRTKFEKALKPITDGLVWVSACIIAKSSAGNPLLVMIVMVTTIIGLLKNIHSIWLMLLRTSLGMTFL